MGRAEEGGRTGRGRNGAAQDELGRRRLYSRLPPADYLRIYPGTINHIYTILLLVGSYESLYV